MDTPSFRLLGERDFDAMENDLRRRREMAERDLGFAKVIFEGLKRQIADFEQGLNDNEEIGALLASFGRTVEIRIERFTYEDPYLLSFIGRILDTNEPVKLIQHVTQTNLLFKAVPKMDATKKPRRIGFGDVSS